MKTGLLMARHKPLNLAAAGGTTPAFVTGHFAVYGSTANASSHTFNLTNPSAVSWTPTAGNTLVACLVSNAHIKNGGVNDVIAGWTVGTAQIPFNATYLAWAVAAGTETTFTTGLASAASLAMVIAEFTNIANPALDVQDGASYATTGTAFSSAGTTPTTTQAHELWLCGLGDRQTTPSTAVSYAAGAFTELAKVSASGGAACTAYLAYEVVTAAGTLVCNCSNIASTSNVGVATAALKAA